KSFEKLSEKWSTISTVHAVLFPSVEAVRLWLDRVHSGPQGGIGRRSWDAEQKQRFYGGSKNRAAQALLDYAEAQGMITKEERQGKLTTAQRFLNNDVFKEALGFDSNDPEEYGRTRPKAEFDVLVRRFTRDLVSGKGVNSRMNKPEIIAYARPLGALPGVTTTRIDPESLASESGGSGKKRTRRQPRKPEKAKHVRFEDEIYAALKTLGNEKLESLYYSLCSIELGQHTPILSIGAWSFFETLTACAGRTGTNSFDSYLNKSKLNGYGLGSDTISLRSAIGRMREYGNTTKHHKVAAVFNGDQLNNDMVALKDVILACIAEAATKAAS
ncbi:MAG: hypothetical protein QOJ27_60, partial [Sphingomonadales bacterium]|nr:hypothetical protein [Sphingomonadales bacterium]